MWRSPATSAMVGLALGLITGGVISWSGSRPGQAFAAAVTPIGTIWVNALRMTVVPLVASLLIATLASGDGARSFGRLGRRAFVVFFVFLFVIAVIGIAAVPPVFSLLTVDPAAAASLRASAAEPSLTQTPGFSQWIIGLAPANVVKAAADGAMLPIIVFATLLGLGLARANEMSSRLVTVLRAVSDAMIQIVRWVLLFAPIGAFALAVPLATHLGNQAAGAIAFYIAAMVGFHAAVGVIFYLVIPLVTGTPIARFARAMMPAQVVVVSTRSSLAALPAMLEGAQRELEISPEIAGFAIPLGVALLRANIAMSWIIQVVFLAKLYGVSVSATAILWVALGSIALSFSVPGIPSGGFLVAAPYLPSLGLPIQAIGILIALDAIPDIFKTLLNVTAHVSTALVLARLDPARQRAEVGVAVSG
ncbi:MAG TPA: dicarboxylate/amino acid:cation symporter [Gemmatimonadaceae bacterium]|jgi:Na+/H+-dicarboxylate symporter|nr:dicarboxylate/amino acid:cation symporter [Gemmatimonadaceae bacterium]